MRRCTSVRQSLDTNPPSCSSLWPDDLQMHRWYHLKPFHSVTKPWPWVLSLVYGSSHPILGHCSYFKAFLLVPLPCTHPLALCLSRTWEYNTLCLPGPLLRPPHVTALIWSSHERIQATMTNLNPRSSAWQLYMYEAFDLISLPPMKTTWLEVLSDQWVWLAFSPGTSKPFCSLEHLTFKESLTHWNLRPRTS